MLDGSEPGAAVSTLGISGTLLKLLLLRSSGRTVGCGGVLGAVLAAIAERRGHKSVRNRLPLTYKLLLWHTISDVPETYLLAWHWWERCEMAQFEAPCAGIDAPISRLLARLRDYIHSRTTQRLVGEE
jgi:hypothetical protein